MDPPRFPSVDPVNLVAGSAAVSPRAVRLARILGRLELRQGWRSSKRWLAILDAWCDETEAVRILRQMPAGRSGAA